MAEGTALLTAAGVVIAALLALFGALISQLYARIAKLEERVGQAEDFVTKLREWAIEHLSLYYRWRQYGAPDPAPIPGRED